MGAGQLSSQDTWSRVVLVKAEVKGAVPEDRPDVEGVELSLNHEDVEESRFWGLVAVVALMQGPNKH